MKMTRWPKTFAPLTEEQQWISNDFMQHWHHVLASKKKFGLIEKFNHGYPVKHAPTQFLRTLEIGAGLGEHLRYEKLSSEQENNYVAVELRESMAKIIRHKYPAIHVLVADCQTPLAYADNHFDRILAIHVLEHLPNLPAAIRELHRLCHKNHGMLSVIIPCEGGLAYSLARKISAKRIFEKRYQQSYDWFISREHINTPTEIFTELHPYFTITHRAFFPLIIPSIHLNLCIGLSLKPKLTPNP